MAGGTALIAGVFGGTGAVTAAVKTARRTSGVSQSEFIDLGGNRSGVLDLSARQQSRVRLAYAEVARTLPRRGRAMES